MGFNGIKLHKILLVTFIICDITVKEIIFGFLIKEIFSVFRK